MYKKSQPRKKFYIVIVVLSAAVLVGFYLYKNSGQKNAEDVAVNTALPATEKIDLSPASEADQELVDSNKEALVKRQEQEAQHQQGTIKQVKPVVNAGYYDEAIEVRSFTPGIYESGGTCTVTASKDSAKITKHGISTKGATTTDCPVTVIPRSELSPGKWNVAVSYASSNAQGSSDNQVVEVP